MYATLAVQAAVISAVFTIEKESSTEAEPPSMSEAVDRVLDMAHAGSQPHVAAIGRHALPVVLALPQHGCACARSRRVTLASRSALAMAA